METVSTEPAKSELDSNQDLLAKDEAKAQAVVLQDDGGLKDSSEAELKKISLMRTLVEARDPSSKEVDDLMIRRFLRARDLDVEKASAMFLKYLKWKHSFVPNGSVSPSEICDDLAQEKMYVQGNTPKQMIPKVTLLAIFAILVFTITPLSYPLFRYSSTMKNIKQIKQQPSSAFDDLNESSSLPSSSIKKCDIFNGEWVANPKAPYYTNETCWAIHEHQNCMKYGRPDSEFLKWKWRPFGCELPVFNPFQFLEIVRGKSMAFVGDSVGRNQMQSMICLLSRVEWPIVVSHRENDYFMVWNYPTYNFTLSSFWTPHLVRSKESDQKGPTSTGLFNLYIDEPDENWITQIEDFDYVILNGGHWFTRSMVFHENQKIVGCHYCLLENVPDLTMYHGYRRAFRTAFKAINNLKNFKGITFLRTFSPSHFENGIWNQGGDCVRRKPFRSNETELEGVGLEFYMIQLEEFKVAEKEGRRRGKKFRLYDVTQATMLRPDGHPSRFGHWPNENVTLYNDCVHWCLPGPIDTWSDFLLDMLKMEGVRSAEERRLHLKTN